MGLTINTNMPSIIAQDNLATAESMLQGNVAQLSSGLRITTAAQDPAGLAISQVDKANIAANTVAIQNANDGVSMLQTADGALSTISDILIRMRELATQGASPSMGASDRNLLQQEFLQLKSEIDRIAQVTDFNGQVLVNGALSAAGSAAFQVGIGATTNDTIAVQISAVTTAALSIGGNDLSDLSAASSAITMVQSAIQDAVGVRGEIGAYESRLNSAIANLTVSGQNYQAAYSQVADANFAQATADFSKNQILVQSSTAVLAQANLLPQVALKLLA